MVPGKKESAHNGNQKQNTCCDREQCPLKTLSMGSLKVQVITVTRAAGAQVVKPLFRLGEQHFVIRNSF
jgi:hypothetical protein